MSTKNFLRMAPLALLLAFTFPAISAVPTTNGNPTAENTRMVQLTNRLAEIKDMTRSELSRSDKKDLRKEVREIKKEMAVNNGGVYLSVGAIIIVILLLILIL